MGVMGYTGIFATIRKRLSGGLSSCLVKEREKANLYKASK